MNQTCKKCSNQFEIPAEDLEFYKRISPKFDGKIFEIPSPSLCFTCRHQKRLSFRNEMFLYKRKCDLTEKQVISMYSPDKPYVIYDQHAWWSDEWDPLEYGMDYDFNRPFFEQYKELQSKVPRMCLNNIKAENSDYCNLAFSNKDSYLVFTADFNEGCAYMRFSDRNYACADCDYTYDSIQCYQCLDVEKGNRCTYSYKCYNSSGLTFCYNMIGCNDCICSANLRNKRYCIFNKEYSKEEYEKMKKEMAINTYSGWKALKEKYEDFLKTQPRRAIDVVNSENSTGDRLRNCKNTQMSYDCVELEDCKYMINCYQAKDCYDWDFVGLKGSEMCHEMVSSALGMQNCHFCANCWENCSEMLYCELCLRSQNLFGCIGIRHGKYCILNQEYSQEEYEKMVARIIEHMKSTGEWGEFFPMELSTFAYNETVAQEYFKLSKEKALENGLNWADEEESVLQGEKAEVLDDINESEQDVCGKVFACEITGKAFKIIPNEWRLLKTLQVPLPRKTWMQRHKDRMAMRNPLSLVQRQCSKCNKQIYSTYDLNRPEPVYCEECYKSEVY